MFSWQPVLNASSYIYQLATDTNFTQLIHTAEVAQPRIQYSFQYVQGTTYYWRVRVRSFNTCSEYSEWTLTRSFTIQPLACTTLQAPTLIFPAYNDEFLDAPTHISWSSTDSANYYYQFATDSGFSNVIQSGTTSSTNADVGASFMPRNKIIYWRVASGGVPPCSQERTWSITKSFKILNLCLAPTYPALLGDLNGDGKVNNVDFDIFPSLINFDLSCPGDKHGDLDFDGRVDIDDYVQLRILTGNYPHRPDAITGLRQQSASETSITLTWNDSSNVEQGVHIYRWTNLIDNISFPLLATVGSNVVSYTNTGLQCGQVYYFTVSPYNEFGDSVQTHPVEMKTQDCPKLPPSSPSTLRLVSRAKNQVTINWKDMSTDEVGFHIYKVRNGSISRVNIGTVQSNVTSFTDENLLCGEGMFYAVSSFNNNGESALTSDVYVTTVSCEIPPLPSNFTVLNATQTSVTIGWKDNSSNELGFKVFKGTNGLSGEFVHIVTTGANVTSFTDTYRSCATSALYQITSFNADGELPAVGWIDAKTLACDAPPPPTVPAIPSGLRQTSGTLTSVNLAWNDVDNDTGYTLYQLIGTNYVFLQTLGQDQTSYLVDGLSCGVSVTYAVAAKNSVGESQMSEPFLAQTEICQQQRFYLFLPLIDR